MPNIHAHFFRKTIVTRKVGETDLVFVVHQDSLVELCVQDYKSLRTAVTICAILQLTPKHPDST